MPDALWRVIQPYLDGKKETTLPVVVAVRLYATIPDEVHSKRQLSLLRSPDIRLAMPASASLAERQHPEAFPIILRMRDRPEFRQRFGVRHGVVCAVAQYPKRESVLWLLETLENCDGQLRYEVARRLTRFTGKEFGGIRKEWRKWWNDNGSEVDGDRIIDSLAKAPAFVDWTPLELPWEEDVPRLFDLPVYAKRVLFIVDRSGSTGAAGTAGTQLGNAKQAIQRAVYELPHTSAFNVLAFDRAPRLFSDRLVPASGSNKARALFFIDPIVADGSTACFDALETGLTIDPNLELIMFLSDGEATSGRIVQPARIVREITMRNVATRVTIHTVGMDAKDSPAEFLKCLAATNFGAYRPIR